jgi:hypothetical protein
LDHFIAVEFRPDFPANNGAPAIAADQETALDREGALPSRSSAVTWT